MIKYRLVIKLKEPDDDFAEIRKSIMAQCDKELEESGLKYVIEGDLIIKAALKKRNRLKNILDKVKNFINKKVIITWER